MLSEIQHQIIRGHGPPREERVGHPSLLEVIGVVFVREDVQEQFPRVRFEEGMDFGQQHRVIFHVFEHFYGHDPVVVFDPRQLLFGVGFVVPLADVAGDDS